MPTPQSTLFYNHTQKMGQEYQLQSEKIIRALDSGLNHLDFTYLLREINDAQMGIVSTLNVKDNSWVRDATHSQPLEERMPHDAPVIEANNALLRCLSRLRAIDYAIDKKWESNGDALRKEMQQALIKLTTDILTIAQNPKTSAPHKRQAIKDTEKKFNTFLIKQLHQAGLTRGCYTEKDATKLLAYYRDLSSVLAPTPTIVTLTYDEEAQQLQRETAFPVTQKTARQKKDLESLTTLCPYPDNSEKNAHTRQHLAAQEADALFAPLIKSDDTLLPAQRRSSHLVSTKNTFVVKVELVTISPDAIKTAHLNDYHATNNEDILWLARSGAPVFTGKGETEETIQAHTEENLKQIAAKVKAMGETRPLHIVTLNTNTPLKQQSTIVRHLRIAAKKRGTPLSYAPSNDEGTCRSLDVAQGLFTDKKAPSGIAPGHKATRVKSITKIALVAAKTLINIIQCASGQDRTGTAVENIIQEWTKQRYQTKGITNTTNIEATRAKGGNAADIASHLIPGSPGMKDDSSATDWLFYKTLFSKKANQEWYRKSARTNKENHVTDVSFLQKPNQYEINTYFKQKQALQDKGLSLQNERLRQQVGHIVTHTNDIVEKHAATLSAENVVYANIVLATVTKGLQDINNPEKSTINATRLTALAKHLSQQSSHWHTLGRCLCIIARMLVPCLKKAPATLQTTRHEAQQTRKVAEQLKQFSNTLIREILTPSSQDTIPVSKTPPKVN